MTKFRIVRFTCIDELNIGCQVEPVMKGGHTHNHFYNVCRRHLNTSKDRRKRMFKDFLEKKTCIDIFNKGVQNPKCRESFVRAIFK